MHIISKNLKAEGLRDLCSLEMHIAVSNLTAVAFDVHELLPSATHHLATSTFVHAGSAKVGCSFELTKKTEDGWACESHWDEVKAKHTFIYLKHFDIRNLPP
jgi:hypothetical protein